MILKKVFSELKNTKEHLSMRRELSRSILGLSLLTALGFMIMLSLYFERGMDNAAQSGILMEARTFAAKYRQNQETPLPTSYTTQFFLDDWEGASDFYTQIIPFDELRPGQFVQFAWEPYGYDEWQDSRYLIIYWQKLFDDRDLFVVSDYQANLLTPEEQKAFDQHFFRIFYFSGVYLLAMLLMVWLYNRRINRHTQHLAEWAEVFTLETISEERPDFRYAELNRIAEQLQLAFERVASLLAREHQFLRHASHELRTPIAVIRANMELLERMGVPVALDRPINRVRRANHSMLQLTETLLWLSRENEAPPSLRELRADQLLDELSEELKYLLQDKAVVLKRSYEADLPLLSLPETPLRIVLSNLLRNAFQYTCEGEVVLEVSAQQWVIENREQGEQHSDSDNSFGLGLMLVKQICERLGWSLELRFQEHGVRAVLALSGGVE